MATNTEADYECKHCGETSDELVTEKCEESPMGYHAWNHVDSSESAGTDATIKVSSEDDSDDEDDDWKTMTSEEVKAEMGYDHVGGVVWEQDNRSE